MYLSDFPNDMVAAVIFAKGFVATARMRLTWGPVWHYNYFCTQQGEIVFQGRKLP